MTEQQQIKDLNHVFFEIGGELLSKPNALAQIIEGKGQRALVFCNTPSDTDLVEVLLKKRGVAARKLIGNVPAQKLEKTLSQLENGEITTIVVTDIAARGLDIDAFDIVVNYTAPSDGDTYLHRINKNGGFSRLSTVATLVGPLDVTNFHYVKKTVESDFVKEEIPDADIILKAKVERLSNLASQKGAASEKYAALIESIVGHANRSGIIGLLLHNTFEILPSLQVAAEREEEPMDDDFDDSRQEDPRDSRNQRGGNRRGGGGRGGRDRDRDDDSRRHRRPYADLDDESVMQAEEAQNRRKPRPMLPPLKEARIYFGKGSGDGLSEQTLRSLVTETAGVADSDIKRVIVRKGYSFFDVLDEQSDALIEKLTGASDGAEKRCVKKATVISTQRQAPQEEGESQEDHGASSEHPAAEVA